MKIEYKRDIAFIFVCVLAIIQYIKTGKIDPILLAPITAYVSLTGYGAAKKLG